MLDLTHLVLDASIATKWYLDDEEYAAQAIEILEAYRDGRVDLLAPSHIRFEVANAIRVASRARRLTVTQGRAAIEMFLGWGIPTEDTNGLILDAYNLSDQLGCALYDGLYLALAKTTGRLLVHADKVLRRTLRDDVSYVLWIGDYRPGGHLWP